MWRCRRKQLAYLRQLLAEATGAGTGRMTSREFQAMPLLLPVACLMSCRPSSEPVDVRSLLRLAAVESSCFPSNERTQLLCNLCLMHVVVNEGVMIWSQPRLTAALSASICLHEHTQSCC